MRSGFTIRETAEMLSVQEDTVRRWIMSGRLHSVQSAPYGPHTITADDLNAFIQTMEADSPRRGRRYRQRMNHWQVDEMAALYEDDPVEEAITSTFDGILYQLADFPAEQAELAEYIRILKLARRKALEEQLERARQHVARLEARLARLDAAEHRKEEEP